MESKKVKYEGSISGITLVALVITIVILIILATIAVNMAFGENGLITVAREARNHQLNATLSDEELLNNTSQDVLNITTGGTTPSLPTGPNGKPLINGLTVIQKETVKAEDSKGNPVVVPGGFKIRSDIANSVQQGVVIEDESGNQFVWIPVGIVTMDDGSKSNEIVLGRYAFDATSGKPTLQQSAENYMDDVTIDSWFKELSSHREANQVNSSSGTNATAKNLKGFIDSVKANKGYYLARYEASYGGGSSIENYRPLSKPSNSCSINSMDYTKEGTLWNFITQGNASKICRNMYAGNEKVDVESDLTNSYAWNTAIVYIQEMGNSNYSNANRDTKGNSILKNTGDTGDVVCNIFDMAGNLWEWTTEYSSIISNSVANACSCTGGYYDNAGYTTAIRGADVPLYVGRDGGFRVILFVK